MDTKERVLKEFCGLFPEFSGDTERFDMRDGYSGKSVKADAVGSCRLLSGISGKNAMYDLEKTDEEGVLLLVNESRRLVELAARCVNKRLKDRLYT
jgi:hypothetical protein